MKKQDLVRGDVTKNLLKYATPLIFTSLFQSVYSIVDIIVVGKCVGQNGISAINNASLLLNLLVQIAIGITVGGNVFISQCYGAGKNTAIRQGVSSLFFGSLVLGVITGVIVFVFSYKFLFLLKAPALSESTQYLKICAVAIPFVFGYNALSAILRALGNSKVTMYFIIISSILNVILDILFVKYMMLGIKGAAMGTMISQLVCFFIAFIYILIDSKEYFFDIRDLKIHFETMLEILRLGVPISLQWTIASISWLGVAYLLNNNGMAVSAGNGVSNKIKDFCQLFISAVVSAGSTMAAQNLGAGEYKRAEKVMWLCMKLNLIISSVLIIIVDIFGNNLVYFFTSEIEVAKYALLNLRIEIIAQLFYTGFMTFNILAIAAGDTIFVLANSFLNCIVVRLVLAVALEMFLGAVGIYIACMIAPLSSVPVGYWYFKTKKWKNVLVTVDEI